MFAPPSELLVAQPMSSPSQKLLGSYVTQSRRLRSESVTKSKYSDGGGLAAVEAFYGASGATSAILNDVATVASWHLVQQRISFVLASQPWLDSCTQHLRMLTI